MVGSLRKLTATHLGVGVSVLTVGLVGLSLIALFFQTGGGNSYAGPTSAVIARTIEFTIFQAVLSSLLSVVIGVVVARSYARIGPSRLRELSLAIVSAPIVLPSLIAIFGIVSIYGNNGLTIRALRFLGFAPNWNIYGLSGILLAHVFFNMPLALRLLLPAWHSIPVESLRLAAQFGIRGFRFFQLVEWPLLRRYLPRVSATIFLICATSFSVVLALGGGPKSVTLEVLIFQSLRYDADPAAAAHLAIIGLAISLFALAAALLSTKAAPIGDTNVNRPTAYALAGLGMRGWDWFAWGLAFAFASLPLLATLADGVFAILTPSVPWLSIAKALAVSLALAVPAAACSTFFAFVLASGAAVARRETNGRRTYLDIAGLLPIALSPMALALGLYLCLDWLGHGLLTASVGIVLTNALISTPFLFVALRPAAERASERHSRLCVALGLDGWSRFRHIDWPILRKSVGTAAALGVTLSLGDLVAVSVYGNPAIRTLTLLLYDQLSAYRMDGAAATALVLLLSVIGCYWVTEQIVGGPDAP